MEINIHILLIDTFALRKRFEHVNNCYSLQVCRYSLVTFRNTTVRCRPTTHFVHKQPSNRQNFCSRGGNSRKKLSQEFKVFLSAFGIWCVFMIVQNSRKESQVTQLVNLIRDANNYKKSGNIHAAIESFELAVANVTQSDENNIADLATNDQSNMLATICYTLGNLYDMIKRFAFTIIKKNAILVVFVNNLYRTLIKLSVAFKIGPNSITNFILLA